MNKFLWSEKPNLLAPKYSFVAEPYFSGAPPNLTVVLEIPNAGDLSRRPTSRSSTRTNRRCCHERLRNTVMRRRIAMEDPDMASSRFELRLDSARPGSDNFR
jgi:hypothetical protein